MDKNRSNYTDDLRLTVELLQKQVTSLTEVISNMDKKINNLSPIDVEKSLNLTNDINTTILSNNENDSISISKINFT